MRLRGYVGGEKIGLLEDEEVQDILERDHHVVLDYAKAGSLDMVTADHTGRDFLFPSSQNALEYYQQVCGSPAKSEIIFNTPLVLYTYQPVLEAFLDCGMVAEQNGCYYMDMAALVAAIEQGTKWADLGLAELYGDGGGEYHRPRALQFRQHVRGAFGQRAGGRRGGRRQRRSGAAAPESHF